MDVNNMINYFMNKNLKTINFNLIINLNLKIF